MKSPVLVCPLLDESCVAGVVLDVHGLKLSSQASPVVGILCWLLAILIVVVTFSFFLHGCDMIVVAVVIMVVTMTITFVAVWQQAALVGCLLVVSRTTSGSRARRSRHAACLSWTCETTRIC
jgi:hypothetical protein